MMCISVKVCYYCILYEKGVLSQIVMSFYLKELKNLKQIKKKEDSSKINLIFCKVMHLN